MEESLLSALPYAEFLAFWSVYKVLLPQGNWGDKRWFWFEWPLFDLQSGSCCRVFFPYRRRGLRLCNSHGKYDKYTTWIKVSGIFGCWDQFSFCKREQIVAPGSEVSCLLHRTGAGQKFHLLCRPASSATWKNPGLQPLANSYLGVNKSFFLCWGWHHHLTETHHFITCVLGEIRGSSVWNLEGKASKLC